MSHIPNTLRSLSVRTIYITLIAFAFCICPATAQSTQASVFRIAKINDAAAAFDRQLRPLAPTTTITGRVLSPTGRGVPRARVMLSDTNGVVIRMAITNPFGYYRFVDVPSGQTYMLEVYSKQYTFLPQVVNTLEDLEDLDFSA